jgi:hypothetical protein
MSFRARLALVAAAAVALAVVAASAIVYVVVRGELYAPIDKQLRKTADHMVEEPADIRRSSSRADHRSFPRARKSTCRSTSATAVSRTVAAATSIAMRTSPALTSGS